MKKEVPTVFFDQHSSLEVEVITFAQLFERLSQAKDHNPFAPHIIQFYLILVVTETKYVHYVDFASYELVEGSSLFIAKNQVHHFSFSLKDAGGYGIIFSSQFIDAYYFSSSASSLNRLFNYHIETPVIQPEELEPDNIAKVAKLLYDEFNLPHSATKPRIMRALLHALLLKAERAKDFRASDGVKVEWMKTFVAFKNLLEQEYRKSRSSREYAARLFISYKLLNDIVKNISGNTVKTFIDDFVTIEIKRYLVSTSLSVSEISYQTGFEEPANMVKFFKQRAGITPLKFRQGS